MNALNILERTASAARGWLRRIVRRHGRTWFVVVEIKALVAGKTTGGNDGGNNAGVSIWRTGSL